MPERRKRARSAMGDKHARGLAEGNLCMPSCRACAAVVYPPSEICSACLSGDVAITSCDPAATVIASALVVRSYAEDFAGGGPWPIASVKMNAGAIAMVHVCDVLRIGTVVELVPLQDRLGQGVLGAIRDDVERALLQARFEVRE